MEKEKKILVCESAAILEEGTMCTFKDVNLVVCKAEHGCIGCYFMGQPNCPCNYNCEWIIYIKLAKDKKK